MPDIVDSATRSRMMAGIRGRDTKPEMLVRRRLHAEGFRYRLRARELSGCPDLVLPKRHAVIFVNGCFWHAHVGCKSFKIPSTRTDFWQDKLESNRRRDIENMRTLRREGWRVATIWECALKDDGRTLPRLVKWLKSSVSVIEIPARRRQEARNT